MSGKFKNRVGLIDDDAAFRESFRLAMKSLGYDFVGFSSAQDFFANFEPKKVFALVIDILLPGMNGLELQEILHARKTAIPVIMLSGKVDVTKAVQAMKNGAQMVLEKPFDLEELSEHLKSAYEQYNTWQKVEQERQEVAERLLRLTRREREVFGLMADGLKNQTIAQKLGISRKTLDIHRTKIVDKMKARTWADIARWRLLHESGPGGTITLKPGGFLP
jgi:two-component system response regulator FixJ